MPITSSLQSSSGLRHILIAHSNRYPRWSVVDLYKLIFQAAMGAEHAVPDEAGARQWLLEEIRNLGSGPEEPLVDIISPGGAVVRVHLRPFVQAGKDVEQLLDAFLRTAREFHGSAQRLETYGRDAVQEATEGVFPFSADEVAAYMGRMKKNGFPAVHHSPAFEAEYRPAYRVVARDFLPADITPVG
jgi:hypothetical protein